MLHVIPLDIREKYEIHEWRNAIAVLKGAHPAEWIDLMNVLLEFELLASEIKKPGGRKSPVADRLDQSFYGKGWVEKGFDTKVTVDDHVYETPTHSVDCFKNKVAIEIE